MLKKEGEKKRVAIQISLKKKPHPLPLLALEYFSRKGNIC